MESVKETVQSAKDTITSSTQSGTEPPSGYEGAGTASAPYDQGNAPEQPTASGTEPPSGQQGQGTVDQPFDKGNQPEQVTSGTEPPSGQQGKGTVDEPFDQGNQPESVKGTPRLAAVALPSPDDPLASPSVTHQGSGNPLMAPTKEQQQVIHETRGRDEAMQRTTSTPAPVEQSVTGTHANGGNFDASRAGAGKQAERLRYEERDVSPGEMRDGSHAVTSGDRGESYTPGKLNKLKDKFNLGSHRNR